MFQVRSGEVLCYRFFDIAEAIDLDHARTTLQKTVTRLKLKREGSQYLQMASPPLSVDMGTRQLDGKPVEVQARLFEQGAVAVMARVPMVPGVTLEGLVPFADALFDHEALDALGRAVAAELSEAVKPAVKDPHLWPQSESYTIVYVREFESPPDLTALVAHEALPRLLVGETKEKLSADEAKVVMEHVYRYGEADLAVVDWNATFLYDPTGGTDLPDVIEIANAQLLELRYYDDVLDRELTRVYDAIEKRKPGFYLLSPWKGLLRELMRTVIELSELIERVDNALKIIGDVYLARVYEGALVQLRIKQWQQTVTRKHGLLKQTYELLRGEVDTGRSLTLETMIVLLIIVEIAMTMLKLGGH